MYSLSLPNIYTSTTILAPATADDSLASKLGNFSSLGAIAGISLPSGTASKSQEAMERIKSFDFFSAYILPNIKLENLMAVKKWVLETNEIIYDEELFDQVNNKWIRDTPKIIPSNQEAFKVYKNWKYEIGKNAKKNLYLYSNDTDYLDATPLFKNLEYLKKTDTIITTENKKLISISSHCYKKCNSTDFLEITGPTNLYKGFVTKVQTTEKTSDLVSQLEQLNKLYKSGTLTKDEFDKAKKKILN